MSATLADPAPDEGDRWFTPEYLLEVRAAVQREHLAVTNIFGMHYDVTPWTTVVAALGHATMH